MADQYTFTNPVDAYHTGGFPEQYQDGPGLAQDLEPAADHGEESYRGSGRLEGRKALVTGADSGIGRAAAIAFAREGADVVLNNLPTEQADAEKVAELIRETGRKAVLAPADIAVEEEARALVRTAVEELGGLDLLANGQTLPASEQLIAPDTITQLNDLMTEFWNTPSMTAAEVQQQYADIIASAE